MTDELRSRLLPVLDLKDGHVVRGIGGRRDEYRPIVSRLTPSSDPRDVAIALRERFDFSRFYVADLGAICDGAPHRREIASLVREGFQLDVDAGVRSEADCTATLETPGTRAILGLETIPTPAVLRRIAARGPASRLVFSLDLKAGRPLGSNSWPLDPLDIAASAIDAGIPSILVLDLTAVGGHAGCPTLPLCREIRSRWPAVELITGGGVRNHADVQLAIDSGVDRILIASALHDGRFSESVSNAGR